MNAPLFVPALAFLCGTILSIFLAPLDLIPFLGVLSGVSLGEILGYRWLYGRWLTLLFILGMAYGFLRSKDHFPISDHVRVKVEGIVCSEVKRTAKSQRFDFEFVTLRDGEVSSRKRKLQVVSEDPRSFEWGDRIEVEGYQEKFSEPRNPGEFDEGGWNRLRGVEGVIRAEEIRVLREGEDFLWEGKLWGCRQRAKELLGVGSFWGEDERDLIWGMILGETTGMSPEMKEYFRSTGTGHIFAVSGQNLGILLTLIIAIMKILQWNPWRWGWMALGPLLFYSGLTGFQSSCMRAWAMFALLVVAWRIDRPPAWLNFWAVTLILVLLWDPGSIQDLGYQLSFLVVLGLIVMTPWGIERLRSYWEWDRFLSRNEATPFQRVRFQWKKGLCSLFAGSAVAFICVLPHALFVFHQVNLISIFINLLVVPLAGLIVVMGSVSLLVGVVNPVFSLFVNGVGSLLVKTLLFVVQGAAGFTLFQIPITDLHAWKFDSSPEIVLVDAGEVPVALIRYRGESWLVNTGNAKAYERTLKPLLRYYGIARLHGVMLTTVSESSNGGLMSLLKSHSVHHLYRPVLTSLSPLEKKWSKGLSDQRMVRWQEGEGHVWSSEFQVRVLQRNPMEEMKGTEERGMELDFEYRGRHWIWANRINSEKERDYLRGERVPGSVDLLIQGRSPRGSNLSEEWLRLMNPRYLIVSRSGKGIQKTGYDPAWDLKKRVDGEIFNLDLTGALIVRGKGEIQIRRWKER
jgi:competence protein ComEC